LRFIVQRLFSACGTLFLVSIAAFTLPELARGDAAAIIAGDDATPDVVERVRHNLGLDRPLFSRFFGFIADVGRGDLGVSIRVKPGATVTSMIADALPATASMLVVGLLFACLMALPLGVAAALRPGSVIDRMVSVFAALSQAVPPFVLALVLILWLSLGRGWFPAVGYVPLTDDVTQWASHIVLPALALAAAAGAELTRQTRGALVDVFEQDYIRTAIAKGLSKPVVIGRHALKGASSPIITVLGLQVARLIGGSIVVERIFGIAGLGSLAFDAVLKRDFVLIRGVVLVTAVLVIVVNLIVDVVDDRLNPKARA